MRAESGVMKAFEDFPFETLAEKALALLTHINEWGKV